MQVDSLETSAGSRQVTAGTCVTVKVALPATVPLALSDGRHWYPVCTPARDSQGLCSGTRDQGPAPGLARPAASPWSLVHHRNFFLNFRWDSWLGALRGPYRSDRISG